MSTSTYIISLFLLLYFFLFISLHFSDALLTSSINSATSFLAGFVIFSVLGYMSCKSGKPIEKVAQEGEALIDDTKIPLVGTILPFRARVGVCCLPGSHCNYAGFNCLGPHFLPYAINIRSGQFGKRFLCR